MKGADRNTSVLLERFWGRDNLAGFHHFYVVRGKWSGLNRISHHHWVKICDDRNGQINLRAKQKYEVLSAIFSFSNYFERIVINILKRKWNEIYCPLILQAHLFKYYSSSGMSKSSILLYCNISLSLFSLSILEWATHRQRPAQGRIWRTHEQPLESQLFFLQFLFTRLLNVDGVVGRLIHWMTNLWFSHFQPWFVEAGALILTWRHCHQIAAW